MTLARASVAIGVALVLVLAVWLFLLRDNGHQYTLIFENAGQLVKGDNVQIGGRPVGSVKAIALTANNQAAVKVSVQEPYAPLHEGTEAVIRLTSLSGIANRYVALSPGPGTNEALGDGATLDTSQTTTAVDLDQLFNSLDPKARKDLQGLIKGFSTQYEGKAPEAAESTKYVNPLLSSARRLVNEATADESDLTRFLVSSSRTVTTIAEKRDDLSALVGNANATTGAIASENRALSEALALQKSQPVLEFVRPYIPELVGWFRDFGQGAANYDANGHYARIQPIFNAFQLRETPVGGQTLVPLPVSQRLDGLQQFMLRRCPGTASQIPPDKSAPFRDQSGNLDCDPTQVPPGP